MQFADGALLASHPCFDRGACQVAGRIHLPVAPRCPIRCNYCLPAFDCANESRPGVTSKVIVPEEAVLRVQLALEKLPLVRVVGLAGPGDPLFNPQTFKTLALVRERFPHLLLCVSTNGLLLPDKLEELKSLDVKFLTITVNAVTPEVGSKVYAWAVWEKRKLEGHGGARFLIERQWEGLRHAVEMGFFVKVNTVMIPGVNTGEIPEIARKAKEAGAHVHNIIPLIPVRGTPFQNIPQPSELETLRMRTVCGKFMSQIFHCRQCRADAVGLLDKDMGRDLFQAEGVDCVPSGSGAWIPPCLQD